METKPKIKEAIVVEGRDDTIAVLSALDCLTIETHGFGIKKETWEVIENAYNKQGIIIFTDPDFSGNEIRRKLTEKFPNAKQAYLLREDAMKGDDIGIENAKPEAIVEALLKAHGTVLHDEKIFTEEDIIFAGLAGRSDSKERREKLGKALGIGYSNAKSLLKKLNGFAITKEEFYEALSTIDN